MWIDADFVKDVGESVDNRLKFDELSKETFIVPQHHPFLTSGHGFDAVYKAAVCFSHAQQEHCFTPIIENLFNVVSYQVV